MEGSSLTPKGERTRDHILDTALELFASKGYHDTTMREIAATAECSLGLTYRYFARKEDLVLALYRRLAQELEQQVAELPAAPLAERFAAIMRVRFAQIQPHRELFGSILGAALSPHNELGVLGSHTIDVRERERNAFATVVTGATNAPRAAQRQQDMADVLYAAHLCLLLFWFYDRTEDNHTTRELLDLAQETLVLLQRLLRLPAIARALSRLARTIDPVFTTRVPADQPPQPAQPEPEDDAAPDHDSQHRP